MMTTVNPAQPVLRLKHLHALRACTSGVAMIEFGLSLPLLVIAGMGGMETANYVATNLQLSQVALMVADNAGRVRRSIDEADIEEVMIGARSKGTGIKLGQYGRVILSSLEPNGQSGAAQGQMIRWQRCFGAKSTNSSYGVQGDGTNDASLASGMGPAGGKITAVNGSAVMFVEIKYDYQPLVLKDLIEKKALTYTAAYTVRERAVQTLTNYGNLTNGNKRLCSRFSAT